MTYEWIMLLISSTFLLGYCVGTVLETRSWVQQAQRATPKASRGEFYYVIPEGKQVEREIAAREAANASK